MVPTVEDINSVALVRTRTISTEQPPPVGEVSAKFCGLYRTIILSVVLYGCKTWSLTLREERRLGVFENRVLRRIFGPKRDEVTGG